MTLFCGEVAEVEESLTEGLRVGGDMIINDLFIPNLSQQIIPAITGTNPVTNFKSLSIIETFSIATCVTAADKASKMTPIELVEIRLANGIGGKAYFIMTGELYDIEASTEEAIRIIKENDMLAAAEIIQNPHPDLIEKGIYF
jgi:microcompartment protein CcmL/EutN